MDSSENSERQSSDNQQKLDSTPPSDYTYEDDFEEGDSYTQEKSHDSSSSNTSTNTSTNTSSVTTTETSSKKDEDTTRSDGAVKADSDSQDKGDRQPSGESAKDSSADDSTDSAQKPRAPSAFDDPQSDDSEPEPEGEVLFTDDQQRAMRELVAQKHDSGNYSDDPPEYNVKERLKELNAELAMEPDPDDRHHRVGFKADLVDVVAPSPEVSDEEDSPRKSQLDDGDKTTAGGDKKKQFVVERDGKFDVVADHELTASERAMFNIPDKESGDSRTDSQVPAASGDNVNNSNAQENVENKQPVPPSKPRPSTANGYSRRNVRPAQSPRPRTASSSRSSYSTPSTLQDFNYNSPYAMSSSDKERAQEQARWRERQKKEDEERRKQEDDYKRQESEEAFQAWLKNKRDENRRRRQEEEERQNANAKEDKSKENEEAYKGWLKTKRTQINREKLLKKRQEQEIKDGYYIRSREECDEAYREWLKKKYTEIKRQRAVEKQRTRSYRFYTRKSRKQQQMARAVRQSQAFRYVDYYGYRF